MRVLTLVGLVLLLVAMGLPGPAHADTSVDNTALLVGIPLLVGSAALAFTNLAMTLDHDGSMWWGAAGVAVGTATLGFALGADDALLIAVPAAAIITGVMSMVAASNHEESKVSLRPTIARDGYGAEFTLRF